MLTAKQTAFLSAYAECCKIHAAEKAAGIARGNHHRWLHDSPNPDPNVTPNLPNEYAEAFALAEMESTGALEDEAVRRAKDGVKKILRGQGGKVIYEPVMDDDGNPIYGPDGSPIMKPAEEFTYSDSLLMFLLSGRAPEKYKKRVANEMTGKNGGPITTAQFDTSKLNADQLADLEKLLKFAEAK